MLDMISGGKVDAILCWKLDRLARNPLDGGRIMHALGKGTTKAIVTPERTYTGTGDDKLLMSIIFGMATKYSDDLSDNVKRGNREALSRGRWPGKPKIGYQRDHATMLLVPDPERFPVLRQLWRLLLSGVRPLEILRRAREEFGLRTPEWGKFGGRPLSKAALYKMFRDPFYLGVMVRSGESYPGSHPPLVSTVEFEEAQSILDGRLRPLARPQHLFFTYGGLIRCGACRATVTANNTVNRYGKQYTYYCCCRKARRYQYCPERSVQEARIEATLEDYLRKMIPPRKWIATLLKHLDRYERSGELLHKKTRIDLQRLIESTDRRLARLRDLLARELINEAEYSEDRLRLVRERQKLSEELQRTNTTVELLQPFERAIFQLNHAADIFLASEPTQKRKIVQALTYNLELKDKILLITAKKPFAPIGEWSRCLSKSAWIDHVKTSLLQVENPIE